ncbi:nitrilase-related carbon-nitrogen hydrolase [Deltaproteobacteria bacterium TL4]
MRNKLHVALCQMPINDSNPAENLKLAEETIQQAAHQGAELVILPEMWLSGYDLPKVSQFSQAYQRQGYELLSQLARTLKIFLHGGSLGEVETPAHVYNTSYIFNPQGQEVAKYRKSHLVTVLGEHKWIQYGERIVCVNLEGVLIGLGICYDLRFPEIFRKQCLQGAEAIIVVAAWPQSRIRHWDALIAGRAVENQCHMIAVNRVLGMENLKFGGHSQVMNPHGQALVASDSESPCILETIIDFTEQRELRKTITCQQDTRHELYQRPLTFFEL